MKKTRSSRNTKSFWASNTTLGESQRFLGARQG